MKLSEDQVVVDALKGILQNDYPYLLEYDEVYSRGKDFLAVKKVGEDRAKQIDRDSFWKIFQTLQMMTGRRFYFYWPDESTPAGQFYWDKDCRHFLIRE